MTGSRVQLSFWEKQAERVDLSTVWTDLIWSIHSTNRFDMIYPQCEQIWYMFFRHQQQNWLLAQFTRPWTERAHLIDSSYVRFSEAEGMEWHLVSRVNLTVMELFCPVGLHWDVSESYCNVTPLPCGTPLWIYMTWTAEYVPPWRRKARLSGDLEINRLKRWPSKILYKDLLTRYFNQL